MATMILEVYILNIPLQKVNWLARTKTGINEQASLPKGRQETMTRTYVNNE